MSKNIESEIDEVITKLVVSTQKDKLNDFGQQGADIEVDMPKIDIARAKLLQIVKTSRANGMFELVDLSERGYHDRKDYPPYNPDPVKGRSEWSAYLRAIASDKLKEAGKP